MALLGTAAMLLTFDVAAEAVAEHDDWHTHEHLPERLGIPGFLRASRWMAADGERRYCVLYEVADVGTLTSAAYLQRLDNPTPWTSAMMVHYRHMSRGLCAVTAGAGHGLGGAALLVHLAPDQAHVDRLREWLDRDVFASLPSQRGIGSVHLLERAAAPPMTNEQRIRGSDAGVDWAIFATGYDDEALIALSRTALGHDALTGQGATNVRSARYRLHYMLSREDLRGRG